MKKTLITLLAMVTFATSAQALSWNSEYSFLQISEETNSLTLTGAPVSLTAVVTMDKEAFKAVTIAGADLSKHMLIEFQGSHEKTSTDQATGEPTTTTVSNNIGLQTNYKSSNSKISQSGLYGTWQGSGTYNFGMNTGVAGFESADFWTNVSDIGAVLTYTKDTGTTAVFSALMNDGSVLTLGGTIATDLKSAQATFDSIEFDDDIVKTAFVFTSGATVAEAKYFASTVIPEPATATLSLLALAGLAARRRRK